MVESRAMRIAPPPARPVQPLNEADGLAEARPPVVALAVEHPIAVDVPRIQTTPLVSEYPESWRVDVEGYLRLAETGVLPTKTELFHGRIALMAAQGNAHAICINRLYDRLRRIFPEPWFIRNQMTHRFSATLAYEPDLALLSREPTIGSALDELPLLVIEVAESTQAYDLGPKRLDYARLGVPEYWVIDLPRKRVRIFRSPVATAADAENAYAIELAAEFDGKVSCLAAAESFVPVAEFVPNVG